MLVGCYFYVTSFIHFLAVCVFLTEVYIVIQVAIVVENQEVKQFLKSVCITCAFNLFPLTIIRIVYSVADFVELINKPSLFLLIDFFIQMAYVYTHFIIYNLYLDKHQHIEYNITKNNYRLPSDQGIHAHEMSIMGKRMYERIPENNFTVLFVKEGQGTSNNSTSLGGLRQSNNNTDFDDEVSLVKTDKDISNKE